MKLLDLFCGPGGASTGYHLAGFDVTGVDVKPQPRYPFRFIQADAMTFPLEGYDAIAASPPCQHYANVTLWRGKAENHPALIEPIRRRLQASGVPWVIENVRTKELKNPFVLCGSMFGLKVQRHRYFETNWAQFQLMPPCDHRGLLPFMHKGERAYADAMGCEWMTSKEAREAIPPAYTKFIGEQLMAHLKVAA